MKAKRIILISLIIFIIFFPSSNVSAMQKAATKSRKILFGNSDKYSNYRIPGITTSKKGTLIAYAEARLTKDDWSPMDIVIVRSSNNGESWSKAKVLVDGLQSNKTVNNPIMIAAKDGTIHFIYCVEYGIESKNGGVFYSKSIDDGLSWSDPLDISENTIPEYRNVIATGPGHGIELTNGTLIIPIWLVPKKIGVEENSHTPSEISTLYSEDKGTTWKTGEIIEANDEVTSPNETTVVELSDGNVMLNIRNTSTKKLRAITTSSTGYSNWSESKLEKSLIDPGCFGSIIRYNKKIILFVNAESDTIRKNITIKVSDDNGKTWSKKRTIKLGKGAYSDLTVDKKGMIHVLIESAPSKIITIHSFPLSWINKNN